MHAHIVDPSAAVVIWSHGHLYAAQVLRAVQANPPGGRTGILQEAHSYTHTHTHTDTNTHKHTYVDAYTPQIHRIIPRKMRTAKESD